MLRVLTRQSCIHYIIKGGSHYSRDPAGVCHGSAWALLWTSYQFWLHRNRGRSAPKVIHKPGIQMVVADFLSCPGREGEDWHTSWWGQTPGTWRKKEQRTVWAREALCPTGHISYRPEQQLCFVVNMFLLKLMPVHLPVSLRSIHPSPPVTLVCHKQQYTDISARIMEQKGLLWLSKLAELVLHYNIPQKETWKDTDQHPTYYSLYLIDFK